MRLETLEPRQMLSAVSAAADGDSVPIPPYVHHPDTPGLYDASAGLFYLRNTNSGGYADCMLSLAVPANTPIRPVAGDFQDRGADHLGVFVPAQFAPCTAMLDAQRGFHLQASPAKDGMIVHTEHVPGGGDWFALPVAGCWTAGAAQSVGWYQAQTSEFRLRAADGSITVVAYGAAGGDWLPLAGDWDGDGVDTIGLYDPAASTFYLKDSNTSGYADAAFGYGAPKAGWLPVAGDWNGDGRDTIGLYDPAASVFYLRNSNATGYADAQFGYGAPGAGWLPVMGDWRGVASWQLSEADLTAIAAAVAAQLSDDAMQPIALPTQAPAE